MYALKQQHTSIADIFNTLLLNNRQILITTIRYEFYYFLNITTLIYV